MDYIALQNESPIQNVSVDVTTGRTAMENSGEVSGFYFSGE